MDFSNLYIVSETWLIREPVPLQVLSWYHNNVRMFIRKDVHIWFIKSVLTSIMDPESSVDICGKSNEEVLFEIHERTGRRLNWIMQCTYS